MTTPLIQLALIEPDLTPSTVDRRLADGWFPFGQRWMTCRAWPDATGTPHDTVWIRIRLGPTRPSDRHRKLSRAGCTDAFHLSPVLDDEHQALYQRFREALHPDWETLEVAHLLVDSSQTPGPLFAHTREVSLRDADGRLLAFRWFTHGQEAIAGVSAVYDPDRTGLGTIARALGDWWAFRQGLRWTYPGYVLPGAADPWFYKLRRGRTEWLDPDRRAWRPWEGDEPQPDWLTIAEMKRRLLVFGEAKLNPGWASACFDPSLNGLTTPYYVPGEREGRQTATIWDPDTRRFVLLVARA